MTTYHAYNVRRRGPAQGIEMLSLSRHPIPDFIHIRVLESEHNGRGCQGSKDVQFVDGGSNDIGGASSTGDGVAEGLEAAPGRASGEMK